jgi:hypothetical protein
MIFTKACCLRVPGRTQSNSTSNSNFVFLRRRNHMLRPGRGSLTRIRWKQTKQLPTVKIRDTTHANSVSHPERTYAKDSTRIIAVRGSPAYHRICRLKITICFPRTELCQTGDILAQLSTPYTRYYCVSVRDKNFLSQNRFTGNFIDQSEAPRGCLPACTSTK